MAAPPRIAMSNHTSGVSGDASMITVGAVAALPHEPAVLGSGSKARVLEVTLADGRRVTVPRANIELIET